MPDTTVKSVERIRRDSGSYTIDEYRVSRHDSSSYSVNVYVRKPGSGDSVFTGEDYQSDEDSLSKYYWIASIVGAILIAWITAIQAKKKHDFLSWIANERTRWSKNGKPGDEK